ncbi:MAG: Ig-like domain-containing protein [Muribaculaceae bacterium]|nr:Ig-like domain-containing protein [Muribaculaceae bacterium]
MKRKLLLAASFMMTLAAFGNPVVVKMNTVSTTMRLTDQTTNKEVALPAPVNREYSLDLNPGKYLLSGIATDGKTLNGTIVINVTDSVTTQTYTVLTCTAYVSNKTDNVAWTREKGDYDLDVKVVTREGERIEQTPGMSTTSGRYTFLALNGNSYYAAFIPSEQHQKEGFMTLYRGGTLTANVNVTGAIPTGGEFVVTVPADAELELGMKFTHFTDFTPIKPDKKEASNGGMTYHYTLANAQVYNYRTWKPGGLTHGGYFTMNTADPGKCPELKFTAEDYARHDPKAINHDVQSNKGYETGDLLLNINPEHHLKLKVGEKFLVHGMRMWEISDNSTNNYFFEPDFHYVVLDENFKPSTDVIEIENADTNTSAWSTVHAKSRGTAIVLVTYDGINLNYYQNAEKKEYLGGEYWGAIWPENTGVFVVTVDQPEAALDSKMTLNEEYNMDALRLAGNYVDAEHDVFYYLDSEPGFEFTFQPEGVAAVAMATPVVSETAASYSGFTSDGVTKNSDGSYTLLLKEGRTIVKMSDGNGNAAYQVLRAKPCHREITNETRPGSTIFQQGDKIKIQYSGLFHPANKIAGIYNMSAYVTYNGVPNGSSLILGSGQYTFGSAPSAQAVTVEIPENFNTLESSEWVMDKGVIQVNGFGDPIGNHRNTSPVAGRSPNFTAIAHKTYFGSIPDIRIPILPMKLFDINLLCNVDDAEIEVAFGDKILEPDEAGRYSWTYGNYNVSAKKAGYECFRKTFTISEGDAERQTFAIEMNEGPEGIWDGTSIAEVEPDEDGVYHITTGAELAYLKQAVETYGKNLTATIVLDNDIDLGNYDWSPIGASSSKPFSGKFDGNGHTISGLYIDNPTQNLMGLFGYAVGTAASPVEIKNVTVKGYVCGKQNVGGIVGNINAYGTIEGCANYADVVGTSSVGGVVGYISSASSTKLTNCYNQGDITGTSNVGGVVGYNNASAIISNIYSTGLIDGGAANSVGACVGSTTSKDNVSNAYAIAEYAVTGNQTLVTEEQMMSGEVAYLLGAPFSQAIGTDKYPVFGSATVYFDAEDGSYYNIATGFSIAGEPEGFTLQEDETLQLEIVAEPVGARLPEIIWSTSDAETVAVTQSGELTALAKGEAVITATGNIDGEEFQAHSTVRVIAPELEELILNVNEMSLDIDQNASAVLSVTFGPKKAETPKTVWSSSDETVLAIEKEGELQATVKALKEGRATVKVESSENPEIFDTCEVVVISSSAGLTIINLSEGEIEAVYDLAGKVVMQNVKASELRSLLPGVYFVKMAGREFKIML